MRFQALVLAGVALCNAAACHSGSPGHEQADAASTTNDAPSGCAPGLAGAPCVLDLYDRAAAGCDAMLVAALHGELDARAKLGPLWAAGRALFRTPAPAHVAGDWTAWDPSAITTAALCGSDLVVAVTPVPTGLHAYKVVSLDGATWSLDASNPAFVFDDYSGNPDGRNSALDTPDSGLGHLVQLDQACSTALGNCRGVTAYLPPGYDAPESASRTYPVLFMHDGQNVWDDKDCCFGHSGWEVNVTLDAQIAAGHVRPVVVIAADNTVNRNNEYGLDAATTAAFTAFQVNELQPHALAQVRGDGKRVYLAGSSLGGLVTMQIGLHHSDVYAGIASLSGSFWVGQDTHTAMRDQIPTIGKQPLAIYVDSGGSLADNSDSAADTAEVRDDLAALGWQRGDSPACPAPGDSALCYYLDAGAQHDELAWSGRAWRFLQFLLPGT